MCFLKIPCGQLGYLAYLKAINVIRAPKIAPEQPPEEGGFEFADHWVNTIAATSPTNIFKIIKTPTTFQYHFSLFIQQSRNPIIPRTMPTRKKAFQLIKNACQYVIFHPQWVLTYFRKIQIFLTGLKLVLQDQTRILPERV